MGDIIIRNVKSKAEHITVSFSINKTLASVVDDLSVSGHKSRSRVITELIEGGLEAAGTKVDYSKEADNA